MQCVSTLVEGLFLLWHLIANGIVEQARELEMIVYETNIDIILINETHLKEKDKIRLQNYYTYRNDRKDGLLGGTAICVRK